MTFLKVLNITKSFEDTKAVNDVSFTLDQGEVLSIIGSSGSGKTTVLRCLNGLEKADRGQIIFKDEVIFDSGSKIDKLNRQPFGFVFQQFNLFPQYNALDNVILAPRLQGKGNDSELIAKGKGLLRSMHLEKRMDHYPSQLSGGQQQRVAIARAMALDPAILFFDEPTSALDPELTREVLQVIKELAGQNMTMVIVTHEIGFAKEISDKIIFMDEGRIVESGTVEMLENPLKERTRRFLKDTFKDS
jgi:polar amino acid transport system ATP-binding protein